jgi:Ser/Thr protein kinase RdoA (MazF antagonist)
MNDILAIADKFQYEGKILKIESFGNGNVNDTFLVTLNSPTEKHFILQRINTHVFRQPELVMRNMRIFSEHVRNRLQTTPSSRRWEVPHVVLTKDGKDHWRNTDGSFWRAIDYIASSQSFDTIQDLDHAREIGYALGTFQKTIADLPISRLADTLEGFHITPQYLEKYREVLERINLKQNPEIDYCWQFIRDRQGWAHVLEDAKLAGKLPLRPIHGDPKINNIMIDTATKQAISIVDLDTVKPGLVHYDLGDCLRSGCNPLGEETNCFEEVCFETELCQAILEGYLSQAREFLTEQDCEYLYDGIRLLPFELGLRFFTDYLEGNVYFKVKYPEHNLARAIVQFKLAESIESQEGIIREIIKDLK